MWACAEAGPDERGSVQTEAHGLVPRERDERMPVAVSRADHQPIKDEDRPAREQVAALERASCVARVAVSRLSGWPGAVWVRPAPRKGDNAPA